ncbi:hypothetical protein DSO57_1039386 [Entomophthora muscae]|uniref:Uncharacterized protein n=1 Tax=Entomophthora muscae TaxID=34485 RepID=A0ACC2T9Q1_9FUNG|nr:hypothetical protein DSO57_1039386 [Entomophthora muscae]
MDDLNFGINTKADLEATFLFLNAYLAASKLYKDPSGPSDSTLMAPNITKDASTHAVQEYNLVPATQCKQTIQSLCR